MVDEQHNEEFEHGELPFSEVNALKVILKPIDPSWIDTRSQGGRSLSYISGDIVIRMLNKAFNNRWSFTILDTIEAPAAEYKNNDQGNIVHVHGRLEIPGWGVREQWGSQQVTGGATVQVHARKAAATDAMKKCASSFGIGLDLYGTKGRNELLITPDDLITDDKEVLEDYKSSIKEAKKEDQPQISPAEPHPEEMEEEDQEEQQPQQKAQTPPSGSPAQPAPQSEGTQTAPSQQTQQSQASSAPKPDENGLVLGYEPQDIEAMKALVQAHGPDQMDAWAKEFFGQEDATYKAVKPNVIKDFIHFVEDKV